MKPKISIIILNWNGFDNTKKCVHSLLKIKDSRVKILVIDNGSKNDEAEKLKKLFSNKIEVYSLPENTGFTGGCNYGISIAMKMNSDYFLLINNDTKVEKDFLNKLLVTISKEKKIGIVGPLIYDFEGREISSAGGSFNWLNGKIEENHSLPNSACVVDYLTGCCLLIKRDVVEKIGYLDDQFFAYFEDAAYCLKARKNGFLCVFEPTSVIYHRKNASSQKKGSFLTYLISRNRILFVNTYMPTLYKMYFFVFNFFKLLFSISYFISTNQMSRATAYFKGYWDGTFGKGGKPVL